MATGAVRKAISVRKTSGGGLRGRRLGAAQSGETVRGPLEPRRQVSYWCEAGHESRPAFAESAEVPEHWPCHVCGNPAGLSPQPPASPATRPPTSKTPYDYLKMRRTDEEGEAMLAEAIARLHEEGQTGAEQ